MKNKAILKRKSIEISLYTPNIFPGRNVDKTYFHLLKLMKKYFILLDKKKLNIK